MVPFLVWRSLDCPITLVEKSQWFFKTPSLFRTGLPACLVFSVKHDGNKSIQRIECDFGNMCHLCIFFESPTLRSYMSQWMILQRDYGQLGNRLHTHANAIAWCLENKFNLINLSFVEYADGFSKWHGKPIHYLTQYKSILSCIVRISNQRNFLGRFCRSDKWLNHASKIFKVIQKDDDKTIGEEELQQLFADGPQKSFTLVRAWDLSCPRLVKKHQTEIRKIFTPKAEFTESSKLEVAKLREKYNCLVGVHARRGDYKDYLDGIHFHSWHSYRNWMIQAKGLMEQNGQKNIGFLLCSDDDAPTAVFANLPVHFMKKKSVISDLHALSLCDYNIGPPSSFGTWLSWHGRVPRLHLEKGLKIRSLEQFSICTGC